MAKAPDKINVDEYTVSYWYNRPFWTDCINLSEPLPTTLPYYLNRYAKEDPSEFAQRVKRLAQVNLVYLINDLYCAMLFSTDVNITVAGKHEDKVMAFANSCNQMGDSLKDYFREQIAPSSLLYGITDVFVDLPSKQDDEATVADLQADGLDKPYCYVVPPLNRIAWSLDAGKRYASYRSMDILNTQVSSMQFIKDSKQYQHWTTDTVAVYDNDGVLVKDRPNPYGMIPAVSVMPLPSMRYYSDRLGVSLVKDVIQFQKMLLNLISLIFDFHESVNFAQRVLIQDTDNGDEPPEEGELQEQGNKRGMIVRGRGSDYKLVTPDANGVEAMCRFLDQTMKMAYQSVHIPSDANVNKTHQTGESIRTNLSQLNNKLTMISRHFEKSYKQILEMSLTVQGIDPAEAEISVQWDTNFVYEPFATSLEQLSLLKETVSDMSKTAVEEYAKKTLGSQLYNSGAIEKINKELEEWKDAPLVEPQPDLQAENTQLNAAAKIDEGR